MKKTARLWRNAEGRWHKAEILEDRPDRWRVKSWEPDDADPRFSGFDMRIPLDEMDSMGEVWKQQGYEEVSE